MRKRWLVGSSVAIIIVAVAAGLVVSRAKSGESSDGKGKKPEVTLEFTPAEVVKPVLTAMPERIEFSGALMAPRTAVVRAKANGTLLTLAVAEGSRVKPGQVLGTIDLSDLQSRAAERSAMVDSAKAKLIEAERSHRANEDLAKQKFISETALETSRATLDAMRAQLKSAQAQLASTAVGIREAALVAPLNGVIGRRNVVPGEKVSAEQELMTVVDLSTLELAGIVGTHQVSALKPGQKLAVRVEGSAEPVEGKIDRIAPQAEAGTRGIKVVVVLSNPNEVFRAGQYASAIVMLDDGKQRLTVPVSAVAQASGQDYVWTLEKGTLVRRIVITGRRDPVAGRVEVTQGLSADLHVIGARFENLKEGAPARVASKGANNDVPAAQAAPASSKKAS